MAFTSRENKQLQTQCNQKLKTATDPVERLRLMCLSRGAHGIKGLSGTFKIFDVDGSRSVDFNEFKIGIEKYGLQMTKEELREIFDTIDVDKSGYVDFDEFLVALRPPMPKSRVDLINKAFIKMDKTKDGQITVEDLKGVYDVKHHPKYKSGEFTEEQVYKEFLKHFEMPDQDDGIVTKEEFLNYYCGISASIDNDAYFDLMMRNAYKLYEFIILGLPHAHGLLDKYYRQFTYELVLLIFQLSKITNLR